MSDVNIGNDEGGGPDYPPYKEDFFQRIVNVNWTPELAVEFTQNGNLTLGTGITGLSRSVISFWFRIPQSTLQNAYNIMQDRNDSPDDLAMVGVVPLLTWGATTTATDAAGNTIIFGPSYIGAYVGLGDPAIPANLAIRLQSPNMATVSTDLEAEAMTEGNFYQIGQQEVNYNYSSGKDIIIAADVWHHVLISFDVTGSKGTMWLALDDNNYNGPYLAPANLQALSVPGYGPNNITATYTDDFANAVISNFSSLSDSSFAMSNSPFAVPIIAGIASSYGIEPVEMADLQVFTGMTLDISVIVNRRAFIDNKGKPVRANSKSGSIKLLHKQPDVLFDSTGWFDGHNKGTAGHFDYVPFIRKFKPDPQLRS